MIRPNVIGIKVNGMTVLDHFDVIDGRSYYFVGCHCGEITLTRVDQVTGKGLKSCGCQSHRYSMGALEHFYRNYKRDAKEEGRSFNLTRTAFTSMVFRNCHYCGQPPSRIYTPRPERPWTSILVNGIDRVNNQHGYSKKNCVACCRICNYAKHKYPVEDFIEWLDNVASFRRGRSD